MAVRKHGGTITTNEIPAGTIATADLAASAVTGAKIATTAIKSYGILGKNGSGAITMTGATVGQRVVGVAGVTTGNLGDQSANFESTITVVNQIQQSSASDLSAKAFVVTLLAASA